MIFLISLSVLALYAIVVIALILGFCLFSFLKVGADADNTPLVTNTLTDSFKQFHGSENPVRDVYTSVADYGAEHALPIQPQ